MVGIYLPSHFEVEDPEVVADFLGRHPFATLISLAEGRPFVSHLPLLFDPAAAPAGALIGHVARANPHAQALLEQSAALAIFHGPHAYVSPRWYREQPAVPTWNYAVAHVAGSVRLIEDGNWLNGLLDRLLSRFEPSPPAPGSQRDREHRQQLLPGIVGILLQIESIHLKFKLGQNRSEEDRAGAAGALLASNDQSARQTGEMMQGTLPK